MAIPSIGGLESLSRTRKEYEVGRRAASVSPDPDAFVDIRTGWTRSSLRASPVRRFHPGESAKEAMTPGRGFTRIAPVPSDDSPVPSLRRQTLPWSAILIGVGLAATLVVSGATLYRVTQIQDKGAQVEKTAKTVTATRALLGVVAARQLKSKDVPAKVQNAVAQMNKLLSETQAAIDSTNATIAATNQTLDATNALIAQANTAVAKAQQSVASLQSRQNELKQGQQKLATSLDQALSKIEARLASIQTRLAELSPK